MRTMHEPDDTTGGGPGGANPPSGSARLSTPSPPPGWRRRKWAVLFSIVAVTMGLLSAGRAYRLKRVAKGTVYVALLLLLVLLFLTSSFFFVAVTLPDLAAWIRYFFAAVGSGLLGVGIVLLRLLNRFINIRVIFVRYGAVLFWLSWCMPLLNVIVAVACLVAHLCGYELPLDIGGSSGHHRHWDWDDWD